jgi:hypothetical protein
MSDLQGADLLCVPNDTVVAHLSIKKGSPTESLSTDLGIPTEESTVKKLRTSIGSWYFDGVSLVHQEYETVAVTGVEGGTATLAAPTRIDNHGVVQGGRRGCRNVPTVVGIKLHNHLYHPVVVNPAVARSSDAT